MSKINKSKLTSEQKLVLLEEGTEPPGSSNLNNEKRNPEMAPKSRVVIVPGRNGLK